MSKGHWLLIIALVFLLTFAYCSKSATAGEMFPLIWQSSSHEDIQGSVVRRLHDPEAGVNCYTVTSFGKLDGVSGGYTYSIKGNSTYTSISCVKVK